MDVPHLFPISGQLFFRDSGQKSPTGDGRKLVVVVGIIAVPNDSDSWPFKPEHQYVVVGKDSECSLTILESTGKDLEVFARGFRVGQLLTEQIWMC
jgi:hypothetical protein